MMQFFVHQVAEIIIIKNKIEVNYLQKKIIKNKNKSSKLKLSSYSKDEEFFIIDKNLKIKNKEKMNESIKNRSEKNRGIHSKSKKSEIINSFIQFPILKK